MIQEQELASARLITGGGAGLRSRVSLNVKDPRLMLFLVHDLIEAIEQAGYMTPPIAQAKPLITQQLAEWGFKHGPSLPPNLGNGHSPH